MVVTCQQCGRGNRVPARHLADRGKCGACHRSLPPAGAPLDVDTAAFDEVIREASVPVLVDFWAPWCGPCRTAAPAVAEVAHAVAGRALVLKVNTDAHPDVAARYGVRGIPNFVVLRHGRVVQQQAGVAAKDVMLSWIADASRA